MRAYGNNTEILIDRDREATSHALLADYGLAPPLLARFDNGLLYKYIQGHVCTAQDLIQEPVWRGVAQKLAEWHARLPIEAVQQNGTSAVNGINGTGDDDGIASRYPKPNIWTVMLRWVKALPCDTPAQQGRQKQLRRELERSCTELDSKDSLGKHGFVFGHCDMLSANVIVLPDTKHSPASANGTTVAKDVAFIDYEYAVPCPAAFDIANHFAEWGGYDCDYNMLPTRSMRRTFIEAYLDSYYSHLPKASSSPPSTKRSPDKTQLAKRLFDEIDRYRGMPGLYWGIWSLIQATISQIDFGYASYAETRLGEYFAWREEADGTRKKSGDGEMPLRERRWADE